MIQVLRLARWCALLIVFACVASSAHALVEIPPVARVTDLTNTLTPAEKQALEQKLAQLEARKGSQVAILAVPTTQPEAIEQYSIRVVDQWKLGRGGTVDDGVLILWAKEDRKLRIEVGYGLEGAIPDIYAKRIVSDVMAPAFRQERYAEGLNGAVDSITKLIDGEALPAPQASRPGTPGNFGSWESLLVIGFILVFVVGGILRQMFGRVPAATIVGGAAGVIAYLIVGILLAGAAAGVIAFLFTLLMGSSLSSPGGRRGGGWHGGFPSGGGGGWSSGGGGGWSGGGGGFGGGGASGDY